MHGAGLDPAVSMPGSGPANAPLDDRFALLVGRSLRRHGCPAVFASVALGRRRLGSPHADAAPMDVVAPHAHPGLDHDLMARNGRDPGALGSMRTPM